MMNVESYKAEFVTAIYGSELTEGLEFAKILKKHGMEAPVFDNAKIFSDWIQVNLPHIVILMVGEQELQQTVEAVRKISDEILILPAINAPLVHTALSLASKNLIYDFWLKPLASEVQVKVKMERAIDRLLAQFAQEQGAPEPPTAKHFELEATQDARTEVSSNSIFQHYESLVSLAVEFSGIHERDPLIRSFSEALSRMLNHVPTLFFRWVPTSASLVLSGTSVVPLSQYRGLGLQFKEWNRSRLREELLDPEGLDQLRTLMKKVFSKDHFNAYTLQANGEILGVFVLLDHVTGHLEKRFIEGALSVLRANVERTDLLLRNHQLDNYDSVTGLHNRRFMEESVEFEMARARRTASPFSMILMELDGADRWRLELGAEGFDDLVRLVSKVLSKTGRTNDVLCRVGEGLFADLLPHTPFEGALVKAEKVRRLVEGTKFKMLQNSSRPTVTLSLGVSEYPTASLDGESLMRSADDAVSSSKRAGGNQVTRAAVDPNFVPDFEPIYHYQKLFERKRVHT